MNVYIDTKHSKLISYDYSKYSELIDNCIEDVKYNLTEYPEFQIYGKSIR